MTQKRTKRPKRRLQGVEPVWSGGMWKWRSRRMSAGIVETGTLRDTEQAAHEDYTRHKRTGPALDKLSIQDALAEVKRQAVERGARSHVLPSKYDSQIKGILEEISPTTPMVKVTEEVVEAFVRKLVKRKLGAYTIRYYLQLISRAARACSLPDPCYETRKRFSSVSNKSQIPHALTLGEVQEIFFSIDAYGGQTAKRDLAIFKVVLQTGLRQMELALTLVKHVDLKHKILKVIHTKTGEPREQPIADPEPFKFLMRGKDGDEPLAGLSHKSMAQLAGRWREKLDLPHFNLRILRHTYATGLLASGATLAEVRDLLGHTRTSQQTMRYLSSTRQGQKSAVKRWLDAVGDL